LAKSLVASFLEHGVYKYIQIYTEDTCVTGYTLWTGMLWLLRLL